MSSSEKDHHRAKAASVIALLVSVAILFYSALCLLKHGIDLPYSDDWNVYLDGSLGNLGLVSLFKPEGDTLHPVGRLLDALAFRWLSGNSVAYQFVSLIGVLGSLLTLQWLLLKRVFSDPWLLLGTFSLTLLMLQPDSYWGLQDGAYHQALPLIGVLGALYLCIQDYPSRSRSLWLTLLAVFAGFSYISGAFATLALAIALGVCGFWKGSPSAKLKPAAAVLCISALATVAVQGAMLMSKYGVAKPVHPLAWPTRGPFWCFFIGVIGRSLMLDVRQLTMAWVVPCIVLAATVALVALLLWKLKRGDLKSESDRRGALIFVVLSAVMLAYLGLVSAGRAQRYAWFVEPNAILAYSYMRFHYYWLTLFWPWLGAALLIALRHASSIHAVRMQRGTAFLMVVSVIGWGGYRGALSHDAAFRKTAEIRQNGLNCLVRGIQHPEPFSCPDVYAIPINMHIGYAAAHAKGASFTRLLPLLPLPLHDSTPTPVFDLGNRTQKALVKDLTGQALLSSGPGLALLGDQHPMVEFSVDTPKGLENCETLEVTALVRGVRNDFAYLYCTTPEQPKFGGECRYTHPTRGDGQPTELSFIISKPNGFNDDFRLDLVRDAARVDIDGLKVRCRRQLGAS